MGFHVSLREGPAVQTSFTGIGGSGICGLELFSCFRVSGDVVMSDNGMWGRNSRVFCLFRIFSGHFFYCSHIIRL